jgi:predicted nucleic acid-binding protein
LSEEEVEVFVTAVIAMAEPVDRYFLWRPQLRDPGDEMVLETAVNGRADALVTFNIRDFGAAPSAFGIEVLLPREAIRRIKV